MRARGAVDERATVDVEAVPGGVSRADASTGADEAGSGLVIPTLQPPAMSSPSAPAERKKARLVITTHA